MEKVKLIGSRISDKVLRKMLEVNNLKEDGILPPGDSTLMMNDSHWYEKRKPSDSALKAADITALHDLTRDDIKEKRNYSDLVDPDIKLINKLIRTIPLFRSPKNGAK